MRTELFNLNGRLLEGIFSKTISVNYSYDKVVLYCTAPLLYWINPDSKSGGFITLDFLEDEHDNNILDVRDADTPYPFEYSLKRKGGRAQFDIKASHYFCFDKMIKDISFYSLKPSDKETSINTLVIETQNEYLVIKSAPLLLEITVTNTTPDLRSNLIKL